MRPILALGLFLAPCLSAAQPDDSNVRGVIYGEEDSGISFKIRSSNCIRLRKPLAGAVHSIDVRLFQECTLYYDRRCDSDVKHVEFYNDEKNIQDPAVQAVKCDDVDARCSGSRGEL